MFGSTAARLKGGCEILFQLGRINEAEHAALEAFPDNVMWETDFPHPTCQHPGLEGGLAQHPAVYAEQAFEGISEETTRKVLHDTAAKLYGIA